MERILFVGFKGKNNASGKLVELISHEHLLLTNSFGGLQKDIYSITNDYEYIVMFGVDKYLTSTVRIEESAVKDNTRVYSNLKISKLAKSLMDAGVEAEISDNPQNSLCNEAYWYLLEKYRGRAVPIHIPSIKHYSNITPLVL